MKRRRVWGMVGAGVLAAWVAVGAGCLHRPLEIATRGIVEIKNLKLRSAEDGVWVGEGVLTGVAIDEHVVLTAAHTFLREPGEDDLILIDGALGGVHDPGRRVERDSGAAGGGRSDACGRGVRAEGLPDHPDGAGVRDARDVRDGGPRADR